MKYLLCNMKNRKSATIFLIFGIFVGVSILSFNISYTEALKNRNKISSLNESNYSLFTIVSTKQLNTIEKYILDLSSKSYVNLSIPNSKHKNESYTLVGVGFTNSIIYKPDIVNGSFFSKEQANSNEKIAIVGRRFENKIYKKNNNEYIKIDNEEFKVIGINKTINDINSIFIPIKVFLNMYSNEEIMNVKILAINKLIEQQLYYKNIVSMMTKDSVLIDFKSEAYNLSNYILTFISFLILIIAIINIINFTVFWIAQRKKEIAIRKVVGATNSDIRKLIFSEILVLSFIALISSIIVQSIIYFIVNKLLILDFYLSISLKNLFFSSLISMLIAIISSIPPYIKSTQIQPAVILKGE